MTDTSTSVSNQQDLSAAILSDTPADSSSGNATATTSSSADNAAPQLSKNALKRLLKSQKWEATKHIRKQQHKDKQKQKKLAKKLLLSTEPAAPKPLRYPNPEDVVQSGYRFVIDCGFEEFMAEKDIQSLVTQLQFSYTIMKKFAYRARIDVASVANGIQQIMAARCCGFQSWSNSGFHISDCSLRDIVDDAELLKRCVYLTADSDVVLHELRSDDVYIVGGLVDHNRYKNMCLKKAQDLGMRHARFPIPEYARVEGRRVLTVNHVVEILVRVVDGSQNCSDWERIWQNAVEATIPQRKKVVENSQQENNNEPLEENPKEEPLEKSTQIPE